MFGDKTDMQALCAPAVIVAAGYTFDPATKIFRSTKTREEYVYDTAARLYRPRQEDGTEPFKDLLAASGLKLQQELSARTEALSSLIGNLTGQAIAVTGAAHGKSNHEQSVPAVHVC